MTWVTLLSPQAPRFRQPAVLLLSRVAAFCAEILSG
jgi:hypothetical protein